MMRATVLTHCAKKINPIISSGHRVYHPISIATPKELLADPTRICFTVARVCSSKFGGRDNPAICNINGIIGETTDDTGANTRAQTSKIRIAAVMPTDSDDLGNKPLKADFSADSKMAADSASPKCKTTMQAQSIQPGTADPSAVNVSNLGSAQPTQAAGSGKATATAAQTANEIMEKLPNKQQVEKFFFRVVAFIYDVTYLSGTWAIRFVDQNIIQNDTVQEYWKKFHQKMEQAKKD